jgi:fatty acid amide hydrolase
VWQQLEIYYLSASELAEKIRERELTASELVEAFIERIEKINPYLNALVVPMFDQARSLAREADLKQSKGELLGPLHGIPVTIKDQFDVCGLPTSCGVMRLKNNLAAHNGQMVEALTKAGAIILGKTNVPQTLGVIETDNAIWGRTNNPWDLTRSSGGSSGGEAAMIAAGGSPLGLGGDFGGSIRLPAAWCGICGIKPTARRLPLDAMPIRTAGGAEGIVAQPGPLARTVADLTLALRQMVSHVVDYPTSMSPPVPFREPDQLDPASLKVAYLPWIGDWLPAPPVRRALAEAVEALRAEGVTVEEWTESPDTQEGVNLFFRIVGADGFGWMKQILAEEKPVPLMKPNHQLSSIPNALIPLLAGLFNLTNQRHLSKMMLNARRMSGEGLMNLLGDRLAYEASFIAALDAGNYDAIICPAAPVPAVRHGDVGKLADFFGSALLFNTLGLPAGVVPITRVRPAEEESWLDGRDRAEQTAHELMQGSAGLPVAIQVAAPHWREDIVLAVMAVLEKSCRPNPEYPAKPPELS